MRSTSTGDDKINSLEANNNLNVIYEEVDLGDRIKRLKGRTIKVKKLVRRDDGVYTTKESLINTNITLGEETPMSSSQQVKRTNPHPQDVGERKSLFNKSNPLFLSTASINSSRLRPRPSATRLVKINVDSEPDDTQTPRNFADSNLLGASLKKDDLMYASMSFVRGEKGFERKSVTRDNIFRLPRNVDQFLKTEEGIRGKLAETARKEKEEAFEKIDRLKELFSQVVESAKQRVSSFYDFYMKDFDENVLLFKKKCEEYKEIGWSNHQRDRKDKVVVNSIKYSNKNNEILRDDTTNLRVEINNLEKEVNKKLLAFMAECLEKRILHAPMFAHTPSTQEYFDFIATEACQELSKRLAALDELIYQTHHPQMSEIKIEYKVDKASQNDSKNLTLSQRYEEFNTKSQAISSVLAEKNENQNSELTERKNIFSTEHNHSITDQESRAKSAKISNRNSFSKGEASNKCLELEPLITTTQLVFSKEQKDSFAHVGIFSWKDCFLIYGKEHLICFNTFTETFNQYYIPKKRVVYVETIISRFSCLNIDKKAFLNTNEEQTEYIILAAVDILSNNVEIMIAAIEKVEFKTLKVIKYKEITSAKYIFSLKDEYSFICIEEGRGIFLCDLSLSKTKSFYLLSPDKQITASCLLNPNILAIASNDLFISIYEIKFEKGKLNAGIITASSIEKTKIITNVTPITYLHATGSSSFDILDEKGDLTSATFSALNFKENTVLTKINLYLGALKYAFRVKNKILSNSDKTIIYLTPENILGVYSVAPKTNKLFDVSNFISTTKHESVQYIRVKVLDENLVDLFIIAANKLLKIRIEIKELVS